LKTDQTLDCVFDGSASTGSPVEWRWTYKIGANVINNTTQSALLNLPATGACGLFAGQTSGAPSVLNMIVQLVVRNSNGALSAVAENQNVSVFPSGSSTCGF
jgi:hypothetical protein